MVPLAWDYTVLDLARACDLEAVVVARPGLGTLNHVAMTIAMLRAREVAVRGVVLNGRSASPDLAEATNPAALARMLGVIPIVETPFQSSSDPVSAAAALVGCLL
jgi:dethiobiotin synthetase